MKENIFLILLIVFAGSNFAQTANRCDEISAGASDFIPIIAKRKKLYPVQPGITVSWVNFKVDSLNNQLTSCHLFAAGGIYNYAYSYDDPTYFSASIGKKQMNTYSKRYFLGFGAEFRFPLKRNIVLKLDEAFFFQGANDVSRDEAVPALQTSVDQNGNPVTDTIYLHGINEHQEVFLFFSQAKIEKYFSDHFSFFLHGGIGLPILNLNTKYNNHVSFQGYCGFGLTCRLFYKFKERVF